MRCSFAPGTLTFRSRADHQRIMSGSPADHERTSSEEAAVKQRSKCARGGGAVFAVFFIGLLVGTRSTRVPQSTLRGRECSADSLVCRLADCPVGRQNNAGWHPPLTGFAWVRPPDHTNSPKCSLLRTC